MDEFTKDVVKGTMCAMLCIVLFVSAIVLLAEVFPLGIMILVMFIGALTIGLLYAVG